MFPNSLGSRLNEQKLFCALGLAYRIPPHYFRHAISHVLIGSGKMAGVTGLCGVYLVKAAGARRGQFAILRITYINHSDAANGTKAFSY